MNHMDTPAARLIAVSVLFLSALAASGCAVTKDAGEESDDPTLVEAPAAVAEPEEDAAVVTPAEESKQQEGEVPLAVAETEQPEPPVEEKLAEVVVQGRRNRHEAIRDLVAEAQALLRDVELEYVFTGKGRKRVLRGRPVAFALWSEAKLEWTIAHVEIPRPPIKWRPGGKPMASVADAGHRGAACEGHGRGTAHVRVLARRRALKVYGRKFPVFDSNLLKKKQWRAVADTAKPIVYLPFTEDTLDPSFVSGGKEFLLATARRAIEELRLAKAPSRAFPGELLADVVPAEVITTLAVIEQTDDTEYVEKKASRSTRC